MNQLLRIFVAASAVGMSLSQSFVAAGESLPPSIPPAPAAVEGTNAHRLLGVAGCTATSCHGGRSLNGGEASAWLDRDRMHRQAYDVLFNDVSVAMAEKLKLKNPAHLEARCLACHSSEAAHPQVTRGEKYAIEFGVGCESCHGAAGQWVKKHATQSWKSMSVSEKAGLGFVDLRPLADRADKCVKCHVGSPTATVDHDLIAAGHPRLAFEFAAYSALLPKHWDEAAKLQRDPGQDVRLWAIGQAASARAMSDVAADRAQTAIKAKETHVMTDLAEFDCNACHHDLSEQKAPGRPAFGRPTLRSPLGTARWGSWSIPSARFLAGESQRTFDRDGAAAGESLKTFAALMDKHRLTAVPAEELAKTAQQSSERLASWSRSLESSRCDANHARQLLQRVLSEETDAAWLPTWDGQAQRYLAIVAASQSIGRLTGREPFARTSNMSPLSNVSQQLQFERGYATPHGMNLEDVDQRIRDLRKSLAQ